RTSAKFRHNLRHPARISRVEPPSPSSGRGRCPAKPSNCGGDINLAGTPGRPGSKEHRKACVGKTLAPRQGSGEARLRENGLRENGLRENGLREKGLREKRLRVRALAKEAA